MCLTLPESDWLPTISDYRPEGRGGEKGGVEEGRKWMMKGRVGNRVPLSKKERRIWLVMIDRCGNCG